MQVEFTYSADELAEALRTHQMERIAWLLKHKWKLGIALFLFFIAIILIRARFASPAPRTTDSGTGTPGDMMKQILPWLGVYGLIFAVIYVLRRQTGRRAIARNKQLQGVNRVEATPEALLWTTEYSHTEYRWALFDRFRETERLFVIYPSKLSMQIIPKRAFADDESIGQFRELLRRHIGKPADATAA